MERSLGRNNRTALGPFSLPDGPDNRGVIDRIIGSLSSLRKPHDESPDHTCLAHPSDEFPPGFLGTDSRLNEWPSTAQLIRCR